MMLHVIYTTLLCATVLVNKQVVTVCL